MVGMTVVQDVLVVGQFGRRGVAAGEGYGCKYEISESP